MQSTPMKETDPHDVFAIESLLAAHAERAPTLAHDPAAPVQVAPPISVGAAIPQVEPPFRTPDARDLPAGNAGAGEIKVDGLKPLAAPPMSKTMKRVVMAVLALLGATAAAGWQQYGDQAKAMAVEWAPPFVLAALPSATRPSAAEQPVAPAVDAAVPDQAAAQQPAQAAAPEQPVPAVIAATTPAESGQLQSMAQDLAAMGKQVDELKATIAQLKAGQAQMARELAKASEAKVSETRPAEQAPRPKVSALTPPPPPQRPAPHPVRKPKPAPISYSPAYAPAPAASGAAASAAPLPPLQAAAPIQPAPHAQTIADDGQPVVRPPMPLR